MKVRSGILKFILLWAVLVVVSGSSIAQTGTATLRGQVSDPSGAVVPQTTVSVTPAGGQAVTAVTNRQGVYEFKGLAPGKYTVNAAGKGFSPFTATDLNLAAGQVQTLDIQFEIAVQQQQVNVEEQAMNVDVNPANNAGTVVIKGKDLDALSDDPDELQSDLQALAGPAAGPNGGQIYIDGFTNGTLPPKSAIREIRINQNPFSSQFDRLGFGRIEVFTKPGTDKLHGQFQFNNNNSIFNSKNPFGSANQPDYSSQQYSGNVSDAISKKGSFFLSAERRNINDAAIVNAFVLDPALNPIPFSQAVLTPRTRTSITPRFDYQLAANNTITARYQFERSNDNNSGIGQLSLASQAFDTSNTEHNLQISDTQIINSKIVNETRFQFTRDNVNQIAQDLSPTIVVPGTFTGGGNRIGVAANETSRYEIQNYTSMALGKHFVKFGARIRVSDELTNSTNGYNGTFTFDKLDEYKTTLLGLQQGLTAAQIRAAGGGASQFSITAGQPAAQNTFADAGLYFEDDWRVRPNFTLSYGMRYETQTSIGDHADFAPRVGIAWGLGRGKTPPKTVLRAGFGIFYDRFGQDLVLQAQRLNGLNQQQIIVNSPNFYPTIPSIASLGGTLTSPTIYQIAPSLRAPYMLQSAVTLERQITKSITSSVTYLNSRGVHQLDTRNINAPLPGTYDPANPTSGVRPDGTTANIYQYESEGIFKQNQLISNMTVRMGTKVSLFGNYTLNFANGDSSGASSFPTNQYNLTGDYGRTLFDVRNRLFVGGSITLPYSLRISPFITASSVQPFNITTGQDLNGDSIFNDRPAFATDLSRASVKITQWGTFDSAPLPGQTLIPINYGTGPAQFSVNMRVSKTIGLGPKVERAGDGGGGGRGGDGGGREGGGRGPGGGFGGRGPGGPGGIFGGGAVNHRYNLTFSASARNMFNHVNAAAPIGTLNSRLFGLSNALAGGFGPSGAANRRIDMQVQFSF